MPRTFGSGQFGSGTFGGPAGAKVGNSFTDFLELKILDHLFGATTYTPPATVWLAVHLSTQLASVAAVGDLTVSTNNSIPAGSDFTIDFGKAATETRTCTSVSGAGPFTVSFSAALTQSHVVGAQIAFDPADSGVGILEPVGNNYARVAITNNTTNFPAAAAGQKKLHVGFAFPTASANWGWQTHLILYDAATSGNALAVAVQAVPQQINNGQTLQVPVDTGFVVLLD